jgi:hypothetical protein
MATNAANGAFTQYEYMMIFLCEIHFSAHAKRQGKAVPGGDAG